MSKTWKWILGILLVVVIVGSFAAMGYAWRTHSFAMASYRSMPFNDQGQPFDRNWNGPMMGQDPNGWEHPRVMQRNDGWGHPMMYERGSSRMGGGFFMLGGLVKLALFFGLLYGAYWLGRRNARIIMDPKPGAPVAEVSAPEAESADPMSEAESASAPRKRAKKVSDL
jgi:hypothetical protein